MMNDKGARSLINRDGPIERVFFVFLSVSYLCRQNTPMHTSCYLVSCVGQKTQMPTKAKDLYVSDWFKKVRRYVEGTEAHWYILSAAHGLVDPETVIAPYEKTLNTMGVDERRAWARQVIEQMNLNLPVCEKIVVFAGSRYREFLLDYLKQRAAKVEIPLEGLRIGEQLSWFGYHPPDRPQS